MSVDGTNSELRSACKIFLENYSNWSLAVINLHLDEKDENIRISQVKMLLKWLDEENKFLSLPHILCGDLNALSHWTEEYEMRRSTLGFQVFSQSQKNT